MEEKFNSFLNPSFVDFLAVWFLFLSLDKAVELDYQWIEFDDVRYHVQVKIVACILELD